MSTSDPLEASLRNYNAKYGNPTTTPAITTETNPNSVASGPLSNLYENKFNIKKFIFPLSLGTDPAYKQKVVFHINVQKNSSYSKTNEFAPSTSGGTGTANANSGAFSAAGKPQLNAPGGVGQSLNFAGQFATSVIGAGLGAKIGVGIGSALGGLEGAAVGFLTGAVGGGVALPVLLEKFDLSRKTVRTDTTISLYMPDNVQFRYTHNFDNISMTEALGKLGAIQIANSIGDSLGKTVGELSSFLKESLGTGQGTGKAAGAELAGLGLEASGVVGSGFKDAALFSSGFAQNPQFEMVFKQTNLREFQFDFKFVPKSADEAAMVRDIIKAFRFHAAPELTAGGGRYLVPPSEFDIEFWNGSEMNTKVPKISTCVLENVDVNYTSAGQWTTFNDGHPIEIYLVLNFKEVEMIHKGLVEQGY